MKLTRFQRHVLLVLAAIGPANYDQVEQHCRQPRKAIRKAVYRLRCTNLVYRIDQSHDATEQGKTYLASLFIGVGRK